MEPAEQLDLFRQSVAAIGGTQRAAVRLGISTRHLERLMAGKSDLHVGLLRDVAAALLTHADACKALERRLSPAFAANLTPDQRDRPPHGRASNRNAARKEA